jgi:hypothetical protein
MCTKAIFLGYIQNAKVTTHFHLKSGKKGIKLHLHFVLLWDRVLLTACKSGKIMYEEKYWYIKENYMNGAII